MSGTRRRGFSESSSTSEDPRLRGRTCAVPFEDVWQAARHLCTGGLRGWSLVSANDRDGIMQAESRSFRGAEHDIVIRITLDENAQTRIDAAATARKPGTDFGAASRRIRQFFQALDAALAKGARRDTAKRV